MLIPIISFEAIKETTGKLPVNVKFLFEGQEEIGSPELPDFIAKHRRKLSCDMIFSSDGLQWTEDEANLVTSLKGLVGAEIRVRHYDCEASQMDLHFQPILLLPTSRQLVVFLLHVHE